MRIYFLVVRKFYVARLWEMEKGRIDPSVFTIFDPDHKDDPDDIDTDIPSLGYLLQVF